MLKVRSLPADLQKVAIEELYEVPERVAEDIEALRTWIEKQPYLKARTDDQFLLAFLRGSKFSLEKAKSKIDRYYTLRTLHPDLFTIQNVDCPKLLELIRLGVGVDLPTPLYENGPRIQVVRPGCYPADKYSFEEVMAMSHALRAITIVEDDHFNVRGVITMADVSQLTGAHMFQMTPGLVKKMSAFSEEALPLRQKGTHIINTPAGFEQIFNLLKPLMATKQQERLYVHGSKLENLYEHIPLKYLPKEYGGENGSIAELIASAEDVFNKYRDYLIEDITYGTDESLRPGATNDNGGIFGTDGSFRQLNVD